MQYVVPSNTTLTVGQAILLGTVLCVVFSTNNNTATASAGETVTLATYGVFSLHKAAGTGTGFAIGAKVYWDTDANAVTGIANQSAVAATTSIAITTPSALNDTLAGLSVNGVQLLAQPLTLVADGTTTTEAQIAAAINANTVNSGFSATAGSDVVNVSGSASKYGAAINGLPIVTGAVTGTMVLNTANGNSANFSGGADGTTASEIGFGWDTAAVDSDVSAFVKLKVG